MKITLIVSPPKLMPWLSDKDRQSNLILLDFEADIDSQNAWRLDLNVAFNPISIRRGAVQRANYYIGSTGCEINVTLNDAIIRDYTGDMKLDVNYENSSKYSRKASLSLNPELKGEFGKNKIEGKVGAIGIENGQERSFTAKFNNQERELVSILSGDNIKWNIDLPRGEKAVRDFLAGNLYLFLIGDWKIPQKAGRVAVCPSDVTFFDRSKRPISALNGIVMRFILWKKGVVLANTNGLQISFREEGK